MFGRKGSRTQAGGLTVHPQTVAVADLDHDGRAFEQAIRYQTGRQMQGMSGIVVGYDRGDPAHSEERVMPLTTLPSRAYAQLGMRDTQRLPQSEIYDTGSTDAELTAYQAAMLARIAR